MSQVDHSKSDEVGAKKISMYAVEPYQQSSEFIDPGKRSFTGEAALVDGLIEKAFAATFRTFAIALVFIYVWDEAMIEACFPGGLGIKSFVCIEERTANVKSQAFHA